MTWCMFASDQSDEKLFHKIRRVAVLIYTANGSKLTYIVSVNCEDIISQPNPYNLLLYVSNESFIKKVRSAT